MRILRNGSKGVDVWFLQRLLNKAAARSGGKLHAIKEDGWFGDRTEKAVCAFQAQPRTPHLAVDGVVGKHTWPALGLRVEIDHRVRLIPQRTNWSCWEAAASMVSAARGLPLSVGTSMQHMVYYLTSGLDGREADAQLARELGWRQLNHSPSLEELIFIMRRGPIYVSGNLTAIGSAHAVVWGGLYSDRQPNGTVIKVYNPSPVGSGSINRVFYNEMVSPLSGSPFVARDFLIPP